MHKDEQYQRLGIREFRKELSNTLSKVDRNRQRFVIGRNSNEVAALIPISDLEKLDLIDSQLLEEHERAGGPESSLELTEHETTEVETLFSVFKEQSIDNSRYEDEAESPADLNNDLPFICTNEFSFEMLKVDIPKIENVSAASALSSLPLEKQQAFIEIYKMIDEAVLKGGQKSDELRAAVGLITDHVDIKSYLDHMVPCAPYGEGLTIGTIEHTGVRRALMHNLADKFDDANKTVGVPAMGNRLISKD